MQFEILRFTQDDIEEAIVGLDGLQEIIVPFLLKQDHEGRGVEDAEKFKQHIMLAKHALVLMGVISAGDGKSHESEAEEKH